MNSHTNSTDHPKATINFGDFGNIEPLYRVALSKAEAAEAMSVSPDTIDRMIARGELRAHRFGPRSVRIQVEDLKAAMVPIPSAADFR